MKLEDLSGRRFGSLIVLSRLPSVNKHTMWLCRCDCGIEKAFEAYNLKHGLSKSCGCSRHKIWKDIAGKRFGRLIAITRVNSSGYSKWLCKCDCGSEKVILAASLLSGGTKSCGCLSREVATAKGQKTATHGESKTRLYRIWSGMKRRIHNPNCQRYKNYGGRGIRICKEWDESYEAFRDWALKNGYDSEAPYGQCTIDRINVDGDYEPDNCRWADMKTQANNQRKVVRSCSKDA